MLTAKPEIVPASVPSFGLDSLNLPALQPLKKLPPSTEPARRFTDRQLNHDLDAEPRRTVATPPGASQRRRARMKLTTIRLYGVLGKKYGRVWKLDVESVQDAVTAIDAQRPGFRQEILKLDKGFDFAVRVGKRYIAEIEMPLFTHGKTICITPVAHGAGGGVWQVIGGVALIAVGVVLAATGYGAALAPYLITAGISLIIGGIAALIAGTPDTSQQKDTHRTSYQFSSAENIAVQGAPCALAYGAPFCGSVVESSSIFNQDYRTGTVKRASDTSTINTVGGLFTEELGNGSTIKVDGPGAGVGGSQLADGTQSGTGGGGGGGGGIGSGPVLANLYPERSALEQREAMGAGGGGGESSGAKEDPDTLSSRQYAAIKDIICEGPIRGLYDAQKSVWLQDTPVQNPDGTYNFTDYEMHFVSGRQDQGIIPGFDSEEATHGEGVQLRNDAPFVRQYDNANLDAIRVSMRIPKLQKTNKKNGDLSGSHVQITIELNINGQGWVQKINDDIVGKASNAYIRDYRIDIPADNRPGSYQIRVKRITADSTSQLLLNDTYVDAVTEIVYVKLRHPNTVVCGLKFNAQRFSNIPNRTYRVYGLLIKVPSNYDPDAHTYTGDWDGTFKTAWTCNPSWILWDILTNKRYGIGNYIRRRDLNKWAFYRAAQYCDQLVSDGKGGMERRHECHVYIAGRQDAMQVVSDIAGIFNAAAAYISGALVPVVDRFVPPEEYGMQFSPDNVIDGEFSFSNTSRKARHTVALVTWNNPENNGRAEIEYVENSSQVHRYGVRELNVTAIGCYSRAAAHRKGLWLLLSEMARTELVGFRTLLEGAVTMPGEICPIHAPFRAGKSMSGRVVSGTLNGVVLDNPVTLEDGNDYQISIATEDGKLSEVPVANGPGTYTSLAFTQALASPPSAEAAWILISSALVPELFRVQSVKMIDVATVEIAGLTYNPSLYDAIDKGTPLATYPTSQNPSAVSCKPPTDLKVEQRAVVEGTGVFRVLQLTWAKSVDPFVRDYGVMYRIEKGNWQSLPHSPTTVADVQVSITGTYEFQVVAYNFLGAQSAPVTASYTVEDANPLPLFTVNGLQLYGSANGTTFGGRDIQCTWLSNSPSNNANEFGSERYGSGTGGLDPSFQDFEIRFYRLSDNALVYSQRTKETQFTLGYDTNCQARAMGETVPKGPYRSLRISVVGHDVYGKETLPTTIIANNPAPEKIDAASVVVVKKFTGVTFRVPGLTDIDLAGLVIYGSLSRADIYKGADNPDFIPDNSFLLYDGSSLSAAVIQPPGTTFYYRFGAYDLFSRSQFTLSEPLAVTNDYLSQADFTADLRSLLGIIEPTAAGLYQEIQQRISNNIAFSSRLDIVYAIAGNNSAAITTLSSAFADYQTAEAIYRQTVQVQVDNNRAAIETEATARATQFGALTTVTNTLAANYNGLQSSVQTQAMAIAGINGQLASSYSLTLNTNGYISGYTAINGGSGSGSSFTIVADNFAIVGSAMTSSGLPLKPFSINYNPDSGKDEIIVGATLKSANYIKGAKGYKIKQGGKAEFNTILVRNPQFQYALNPPTFSPTSSSFSGNINVTVNGPANATIYYTTDGTDPVVGGSASISSGNQIGISGFTVLKALAYIPDPSDDDPTTVAQTSPTATAFYVQQ